MIEQLEKLTQAASDRYHRRGMSEAATMEKGLLGGIDQAIYDSWKEDLSNPEIGASEREGIWAAIKSGVSKGQQKVKDLADSEITRLTDEIAEKETKKRPRSEIERNMEKFVEDVQRHSMKGNSQPKHTEILREKKDLAKIGWGEVETKEVERKIQIKMGWDEDDERIKSAIDLLMATGRTASDIANEMGNTQEEFRLTAEDYKKLDENPRLTAEDIINSKKLNWFSKLGLDQKYIQRFILLEEFAEHNENDYQHSDPQTIEEIAWQIMHHYGHKDWGPKGKFPILEMRLAYKYNKKTGKLLVNKATGEKVIDPERSKYFINQANVIRWARERMWNIYDVNNDVQDFFSSVNLPKTFGAIDLGRIFPEFMKYFASEDKSTTYYELAQQMIVEAYAMGTINTMNVKYREAMKDPKLLQEEVGKMFASNAFTKEVFRKNLFELMALSPLNYEGSKKGEFLKFDGIMGAAIIDMFLVYYNLSDWDGLVKLLGRGSTFFTRDGYIQALQTVIKDRVVDSSGELSPTVLNQECQESFRKAFDKNGQITSEENKNYFIKLINFYGHKLNNQDAEYTVRRMLYRMVQEKYGRILRDPKTGEPIMEKVFTGGAEPKLMARYALTTDLEGTKEDDWTLRMAWVAASGFARVFGGGARNDTTAQGYDGFTKMHLLETYRDKMMNKNADERGNEYTIHMFKILAMDFCNAVVTESYKEKRDSKGNIVYGKDGKPVMETKNFMEVLLEVHEMMTAHTAKLKQLEEKYAGAPSELKAIREKELEQFKHKMERKYQNVTGQIAFKARAMSNYYDDHLMRAHETYQIILGSEELKMDKYVTYDAYGGVRFNREEFQKDVQHKVIHPIRYFLNTYPDIAYNQKFRMLDQAATIEKRHHEGYDAAPVYREMTLGEAMFGHQMFNRKEFWLRDKKGKPIEIRDSYGRKHKGLYEIDWDKVNADKTKVWKQWFMTKIAADLHAHRAFHSTDPRFDINYYNNVIKAIESIETDLEGDQYSLTQKSKYKHFFDKDDMKWFRKMIKVENYDLFFRAVFKDLLLPDQKEAGIGLLLMFSLAAREIVRREG